MRTYVTVAMVAALHVGAAGSLVFVQGCRSTGASGSDRPATVTPAPMPPSEASLAARPSPAFKPTYTPPPIAPRPAPAAAAAAPAGGDVYVIQKGDSLGKVAKKFGVPAGDLASANNITDPNRVRVGQKLKIPASTGAPAAASKPAAAHEPALASTGAGGPGSYVVQAGDILSRIAARFNVTVAALREANHLASDKLLVGQKLVIPSATASSSAAAPAAPAAPSPLPLPAAPAESPTAAAPATPPILPPSAPSTPASPAVAPAPAADAAAPVDAGSGIVHVARDGETMAGVAKLYLVKLEDLAKANGLSENSPLTPGQRLRIP